MIGALFNIAQQLWVVPASADDGGPGVLLDGVEYTDQIDGSGTPGHSGASNTSDQVQYTYTVSCGIGGQYICYDPEPCAELGADGQTYDGLLYDVVAPDGSVVGQTCITDAPGEPAAPPQVTPGMVVRAFKALEWPASELTIQPPNGRTAVNFDTYFFTDDTAPITQQVRLLGQQVIIEATPTEFTWHWGDATTATTTSPGGPYPQGDVVHQYLRTGGAAPSLDTTYTGRYRVNAGPWTAIPASHTVAGPAQALEIVEVRPTLVGGGTGAYG